MHLMKVAFARTGLILYKWLVRQSFLVNSVRFPYFANLQTQPKVVFREESNGMKWNSEICLHNIVSFVGVGQ